MLECMVRFCCAVLGTLLLAARVCFLGGFGLGAVLCAGYALYELWRYGGFSETSLASLHPGIFEYLLPPRHVVLNTAFIACAQMPLAALFGIFFLLALLFDRLARDLLRRVERLLRTDNAI